jgi:predicted NodU family carbamoyl transferase
MDELKQIAESYIGDSIDSKQFRNRLTSWMADADSDRLRQCVSIVSEALVSEIQG